MATMGNPRDYLILTNNPLVHRCMEGQGLYTIRLEEDKSFREILAVFDKFKPIVRELPDRVLRDFQLIDYTLLAGAIGFDAEAGLRRVQEAEGR